MSPTGFGSVPCEKLEILLDGERLQLVDWQGSRRLGTSPANCGGESAPASQRARGTAGGGRAAPRAADSRGRKRSSRRGGTPMRARFKTTAGAHMVGATFPATNFAPVLDLDQHFMRDTVQTGPTPGFHVLPACRNVAASKGRSTLRRRKSRHLAPGFSRVIRRPLTRKRHARAELPQPLQRAPSGVRLPAPTSRR